MEFELVSSVSSAITDQELGELLTQVYVDGGYTKPEEAVTLFAPSSVRMRGVLIGAREKQKGILAGIIIVVPPGSPARKLAQKNEAEIHLLGVKPAYQQQGLGRMLVEAAIANAKHSGYTKLILWTQSTMTAAQKIYSGLGFIQFDDFEKNGRTFKVFEKYL